MAVEMLGRRKRKNKKKVEYSREQQGALSGHLLSTEQVVVAARTEDAPMSRAAPNGKVREVIMVAL